MSSNSHHIVVDIGNSRIKFGLYDESPATGNQLPKPAKTLELASKNWEVERLANWLLQQTLTLNWTIASVNRDAAKTLLDWIQESQTAKQIPAGSVRQLQNNDLGLEIRVDHPERVGIDRLLGALGANVLRNPKSPAIVIDLGTALKVHLVTADGAFCGGSISPGIEMSARAMHDYTDLLPLISMSNLDDPPAVVGKSTIPAMQSGLYWGTVGAMRELVAQMSRELSDKPDIFLTGGAASSVAAVLDLQVQHVPHLILSAIALVAERSRT